MALGLALEVLPGVVQEVGWKVLLLGSVEGSVHYQEAVQVAGTDTVEVGTLDIVSLAQARVSWPPGHILAVWGLPAQGLVAADSHIPCLDNVHKQADYWAAGALQLGL